MIQKVSGLFDRLLLLCRELMKILICYRFEIFENARRRSRGIEILRDWHLEFIYIV